MRRQKLLTFNNSAKFEKYRAEQREEKKRLLLREVRQVTLEIHAQGVYPSQARVYSRSRSAGHLACHAERTRMGRVRGQNPDEKVER